MPSPERLDPVLYLALAWQPAATRPALEALLMFDARLGAIVTGAREPMLAQIKLGWWRERLGELDQVQPAEPLLRTLSETWGTRAGALQALVDGWEAQLEETTDGHALSEARAASFEAFSELAGAAEDASNAADVGRLWSCAQRGDCIEASVRAPRSLSKQLRGLAVLSGLAARALGRGSLLRLDRSTTLAAWRLGMFGR